LPTASGSTKLLAFNGKTSLLSHDITSLLAGWDFNPDDLQVRMITGDDGSEKLQMRMDMGLLPMEISGRPDGTQPHGFESLLEYFEAMERSARVSGAEFSLDSASCAGLMREGLQYYHRYLSAFHLQRYDLVIRDTERNLRLFAFVVNHAGRQRDKLDFDRYRPYVEMMRCRALALSALSTSDFPEALEQIDEGIKRIRQFLKEYHQEGDEAECAELRFLLRWRRDVERDRPSGALDRIQEQLDLAVALEDYEEAARLRDQLSRLRGSGVSGSHAS
jgi:hypothetical protein